MVILFAVVYILLSIALSIAGIEKLNEGAKIFIISLLLTPFVGAGYLIYRKRNSTKITFYNCPECEYVFPVKIRHCPICEENGLKVRLKIYTSPHTISKRIEHLSF